MLCTLVLFQAGAARVYAVEASGMARFARLLADANPSLGLDRITVINAKVEEVQLDGGSVPMGTLLGITLTHTPVTLNPYRPSPRRVRGRALG